MVRLELGYSQTERSALTTSLGDILRMVGLANGITIIMKLLRSYQLLIISVFVINKVVELLFIIEETIFFP